MLGPHYIIPMMETEFDHVIRIAGLLRRAGGRALLAGGCVRDHLLGRAPEDFDIEVYGLTAAGVEAALAGEYALDAVGMSFGVMKVRHHEIDIALPRSENKIGRGHRGFVVETRIDMDFASASARRDFTVNAMMMDALTGEVIDPWHGQDDLRRGILRHVSEHFSEDPLRVLRGMQFIARFRLVPAPETLALCAALSQEELPRERIAAEWEKMLRQGELPSAGLNFLRKIGFLRFYPELAALCGCPQDPRWHPEGDVWTHTLATLDAAAKFRYSDPEDKLTLMLAALCHDFGKVLCTATAPDGGITSRGHDTLTEPARRFLTRLWNRETLTDRVLKLIRCHMQPWQLIRDGSGDRAFRHLALAAERLDLLADLAECDVRGIAASPEELAAKLGRIAEFRARAEFLAVDHAPPKPLIMGRHLLERGIAPGPGMRPWLDRCFAAQLEGKFSDLDGAMNYLDSLL
ncbi:MAG: HD domain-containing protein [Lentisphaeria bacterium]|nr:HD domain-containing protein [Lentisphaeria bacterium]